MFWAVNGNSYAASLYKLTEHLVIDKLTTQGTIKEMLMLVNLADFCTVTAFPGFI